MSENQIILGAKVMLGVTSLLFWFLTLQAFETDNPFGIGYFGIALIFSIFFIGSLFISYSGDST